MNHPFYVERIYDYAEKTPFASDHSLIKCFGSDARVLPLTGLKCGSDDAILYCSIINAAYSAGFDDGKDSLEKNEK